MPTDAVDRYRMQRRETVAEPQKLSDGGRLQLWLEANGSRLWCPAYRFDGKQKLLALGKYPIISLADARKRREDAKNLLARGVDPPPNEKNKS